MTDQGEPTGSSRSYRSRNRRVGWTIRITPLGVLLLMVFNLLVAAGLVVGVMRLLQASGHPWLLGQVPASETPLSETTPTDLPPTQTSTRQPTVSPTTQPSSTLPPNPGTPSPQPVIAETLYQGLIILALDEGGNKHIYAYQPQESAAGQSLPLTRLTYGPWDDVDPAISPDGRSVAFASNRSGYWDIYLLDLDSSRITRMTDTLAYDGAPAWSPDNQWLVYETYINDNLEIKIQSVSTVSDTVQLTNNRAADFSPVWSPGGRQIAFVSSQSGENEIWIADLDDGEDQRFTDISQSPGTSNSHPSWSPDGKELAWVSEQDGMRNIFIREMGSSAATSTPGPVSLKDLGSGDWPVWSPDGLTILTSLDSPNHYYLTAYPVQSPGLVFPTIELPGKVDGLSWGNITLSSSLQAVYQQAAMITPTELYNPALLTQPTDSGGRYKLAPLDGVTAPQAYLHDLVDESFQALRKQIAAGAGWDFLSNLENAYVPLTAPLDPGLGNDWLYTGRAFAVDTVPMNAGWLVVVRENFSTETYWRVYIKAFYQDGSAGVPLHELPWNFDGRNNSDVTAYEQGGEKLTEIPPGYWIDFTSQALAYGWERMPALPNWRDSYRAARFNEFAMTGGLDWQTAMLQLYPPEVLITPSPVYPPTKTPTATLRWYVSPTPTLTATPRPTFTPGLEATVTVTTSPGE